MLAHILATFLLRIIDIVHAKEHHESRVWRGGGAPASPSRSFAAGGRPPSTPLLLPTTLNPHSYSEPNRLTLITGSRDHTQCSPKRDCVCCSTSILCVPFCLYPTNTTTTQHPRPYFATCVPDQVWDNDSCAPLGCLVNQPTHGLSLYMHQ